MNILLAWFGHETNTFSRRTSDFNLLTSQGYWEALDILDTFRGTPSYLGGMIEAAEEQGINLVPSIAVENAGPPLTDACLEQVTGKLCGYIDRHHQKLDGICLALHGAGVSQSCMDIESYTLQAIRQIVGPDLPIMITLDLHANVSKEMTALATGLFGIKENPHTDYAVTGIEAMNALINTIQGNIFPCTAVTAIPMLMPMTPTTQGPCHALNRFIRQYRQDHHLLDAAFFHGFPYADIPDAGATVFVTADRAIDAQFHADRLADHIWQQRTSLVTLDSTPADEALQTAHRILAENKQGFVVINEASDNPGGGAPGDGTHLLAAMIEADHPGSAFAYMYDPESVERAVRSGVGRTVDLYLGGKIEDEKHHGPPLHLKGALVHTISDGRFISTTPLMKGIPGSFGASVGIRYGNVDIVVCSVQNQTYDDRAFVVGGIDINQKRLLGLKSAQHFKAFFQPRAIGMVPANSRGITTSNLSLFEYRHIRRPVYPLDKNVSIGLRTFTNQ